MTEHLIKLKKDILRANAPIQESIIRQAELRSKIAFLNATPARDGKERHDYQNTDVEWVATFKKEDIDSEVRSCEAAIDAIQDELDAHNHTVRIEVAQRALDLAGA